MITTHLHLRQAIRLAFLAGLLALVLAGLVPGQAQAQTPEGPAVRVTSYNKAHASQRYEFRISYPSQNEAGQQVRVRNWIRVQNGHAWIIGTKMYRASKDGNPRVKMTSRPKAAKCRPGQKRGRTRAKLIFVYQPNPATDPGWGIKVGIRLRRCGVKVTSTSPVYYD